MEPTQAKPVKKRRRWLIVAVVLVLLSLVLSWWYWPRGDARFVGKWIGLDNGEPGWRLSLKANGLGYASNLEDSKRNRFVWRVDGDRLTLGAAGESFIGRTGEWISRAFTFTGIASDGWHDFTTEFAVIDVTKRDLHLRRLDGVEFVYERIPE